MNDDLWSNQLVTNWKISSRNFSVKSACPIWLTSDILRTIAPKRRRGRVETSSQKPIASKRRRGRVETSNQRPVASKRRRGRVETSNQTPKLISLSEGEGWGSETRLRVDFFQARRESSLKKVNP